MKILELLSRSGVSQTSIYFTNYYFHYYYYIINATKPLEGYSITVVHCVTHTFGIPNTTKCLIVQEEGSLLISSIFNNVRKVERVKE